MRGRSQRAKRHLFSWICCCNATACFGIAHDQLRPVGQVRAQAQRQLATILSTATTELGNSTGLAVEPRQTLLRAMLVNRSNLSLSRTLQPVEAAYQQPELTEHMLGDASETDVGKLLTPWEWYIILAVLAIFSSINYYILYRIPIENVLSYSAHLKIVTLFVLLAGVFNGLVYISAGREPAVVWFAGYLEETVFSLENIFVFLAIITKFQTPPRNTMKALMWTVNFQIIFQGVCYLGLADFLKSLYWLPNVLGVWLIYMGISSSFEEHHVEDLVKAVSNESGNLEKVAAAMDSPITCLFQWTLGDRFWPRYLVMHKPRVMFVNKEGQWRCSMLAPVILSLMCIDFCFEADVTVAKIEAIENHYIAFSSSVLAAFALPEMYFIARLLFERYFLLRYGVSFILVFFGVQLLIEDWYELPAMLGVCIVVAVMVLCVCVSALLGWMDAEKGRVESEHNLCEKEGADVSEADGTQVARGIFAFSGFDDPIRFLFD